MWVEASVEARKMDAVQAILTVLGCKANQDVQPTPVHLGVCPQQDQVPGLGEEL